MITEINAAIQGTKVLKDFIGSHKELANYNELSSAVAEVNSKLIDAQHSILDYQASNKALIEKIAELEEKLSGKEKFDREISRYILHKLKSGMLVYRIKPEHEEMGEPHYICTQCANNGKISLFQMVLNGTRLVCDSCKKNVMTGWKPGIHKAS
jgi:hypothetical protein